MAKTLTILHTNSLTEIHGQIVESIVTRTDQVADDNKINAYVFNASSQQNRGQITVTLLDKNGATVAEVSKAIRNAGQPFPKCELSTEAGAAAPSTANDLANNFIGHIVDAATFATGKMVISYKGSLTILQNIEMKTTISTSLVTGYLGQYQGNGTLDITVPFTVSEA